MKRKTEIVIFFSSLVVVGAVVVGSIAYFNTGKQSEAPLLNSPPPAGQASVDTIPTGTIVIAGPSSSTAPAPASLTLPYSLDAMTSNETYWPKDWGGISFVNGGLIFTPDPNPNGANSFLNGASSWTNYQVSTDVSRLNGGWFDIVARVANQTQNFVYCEFGPNGTEIIERVNASDAQIASSVASTTSIQGAEENFGMKVYGNDVACMMAGKEVVGTEVQSNEAPAGGIGFVIFGQPHDQGGVELSNISVSALTSNTIIAPFTIAPAAPSTPPSAVPPTQTAPGTPPVAAPPQATTTLSLPYSTSIFDSNDWYEGWGSFSTASGTLTVGSNNSITSGGIFLVGDNSWTDYKFTAYVEWISGQMFELVGRRTDGGNLIECIYNEADSANTTVSINMISNGQTTVLTQGQTFLDDSAHMTAVGFDVSMTVQGPNVQCEMDNQSVYATIPNGLLEKGGIGFITWDPQPGNSQINVTKISVTPL